MRMFNDVAGGGPPHAEKIISAFQQDSMESTEVCLTGKKAQIIFSDRQRKLVEKLEGTIGDTDSEIIRNIVIAYLSEKSYIRYEALDRNK